MPGDHKPVEEPKSFYKNPSTYHIHLVRLWMVKMISLFFSIIISKTSVELLSKPIPDSF